MSEKKIRPQLGEGLYKKVQKNVPGTDFEEKVKFLYKGFIRGASK